MNKTQIRILTEAKQVFKAEYEAARKKFKDHPTFAWYPNSLYVNHAHIDSFIRTVEKYPDVMDHNFWNEELAEQVKREDLPKEVPYDYTIFRNPENGEYDLTLDIDSGNDAFSDLNLEFNNYLDEDEAKDDIKELRRLGYKINE